MTKLSRLKNFDDMHKVLEDEYSIDNIRSPNEMLSIVVNLLERIKYLEEKIYE